MFAFPLFVFLRDLSNTKRRGEWASIGLMFALTVGMWWLFLTTRVGNHEDNITHVPLPLLMLALVLLTYPRGQAAASAER